MVNEKFVAYYRVSTKRQGESGFGLDAQQDIVIRQVAVSGGRFTLNRFHAAWRIICIWVVFSIN